MADADGCLSNFNGKKDPTLSLSLSAFVSRFKMGLNESQKTFFGDTRQLVARLIVAERHTYAESLHRLV